jgi:hypothetical protein
MVFTVTMTVSPVLNAVVLATSQIVSAAWALTLKTAIKVRIIARKKVVKDFMVSPETGTRCSSAPLRR